MYRHIFGNTFSFDNNNQMDNLEKRAEHSALLNEVRKNENIQKSISDMSVDEMENLIRISGMDLGESGL